MAVIFSSDFSNINIWDYHFGVGTPSLGCDRGPCLSCGQVGNFGVWKVLGTYIAGTARMMFAAVAQSPATFSFDPFLYLWTPTNDILFEIRVNDSGSFTIHAIGGSVVTSPVGIIPVDGTFHTLQITWSLRIGPDGVGQGVFADFQFVLDNIVKYAPTNFYVSAYDHGGGARDYHWKRIGFAGNIVQTTPHFMNIAIDNVEVEDIVIVKTMIPCPTGQLSNIACALFPPVPPDLSGIFVVTPGKKHDSYYNAEKKIPDPTIRTGRFGE